ncbi:AAA domain-containing protein [Pseudomonas sp. NFPP10]|jgi:predicted kinase|uniref:AAA family ATPase n=1 Tax=Pseudomonas TaxID=286 RepID=UPI0006434E61|nr:MULTISPECIES: AAA family ATPase [Pseudomonas]POA82904.1 kinase [Pseudomonas protegens]PZP08989.1 MAG: kinase [Pseudomonas protegens]QYN04097.1 AAA family ATPase [Pseudomonas protegens]ROM15354.1 kinase [Pseudomonas protegens]URN91041.1 MAG: AAA family ATPase [Pseudomonas protegens]
MLIVFSGLPGTGKTTIARTLAPHLAATYLRIDSIEQGLRDAGLAQVGKAGYQIALQLAEANLALGNRVLADCVNPVQESRQAWQALASRQGVRLLEIEVVCSDLAEHRRRVETRQLDVPGLRPPSWQSVLEHDYQPWASSPLRLDTAQLSPQQALALILACLPGA